MKGDCKDGMPMKLTDHFSVGSVEPSGSASRKLIRRILRKYVVRMGGGWNWLRIMSNHTL
jgi:hypothetical protein